MRLVAHRVLAGGEVHWLRGTEALANQGYHVISGNLPTGGWRPLGRVPVSTGNEVLSRSGLVCRALRLGVHNLWRTPTGTILAVSSGCICRSENDGRSFSLTHRFRIGRKPAHAGFTVTNPGQVLYGEYVPQGQRIHPISIYRSSDDGRTFEQVHRFEAGQVRHVHFIQPDPYGPGLWVGTGDLGDECRLLRSADGCETFETIGAGGQQWRAVSLLFRPDAVYWGTDAGSDAGSERNRIYRWDRSCRGIEEVQAVQGPVHGSAQLPDGTLLMSTGVEGGVNERDDRAHLWASRDGRRWQEVASWRKDIWPFRVQYGVIHFPHGQETCETLCLNLKGLAGFGTACLAGRIEESF